MASYIKPAASVYGVTGIGAGPWTSSIVPTYGYASFRVTWYSDADTTVSIAQGPDSALATTLFTTTLTGTASVATTQLIPVQSEYFQITVTFGTTPTLFTFETFDNTFFFNNYTLITSQTLTTGATGITISNIPQNFTNLKVMGSLKSNYSGLADGLQITLNGDSGTNYSWQLAEAYSGSNIYGDGAIGVNQMFLGSFCNNTDAAAFSNFEFFITEYAGTLKYKYLSMRMGALCASDVGVGSSGVSDGLWANTAPVQSFTIFSSTSSLLQAGCSVYVYGL